MNEDLSQVRVAVLGAGKMGGILLQAFLKQQLFTQDQLTATVAHEERAQVLSAQWGVEVTTDNVEAAKRADLILLGVKPFQVADLVSQIKPSLTADKMLISFATGVKTSTMEEASGLTIPVIRSMPNTPSMLGVGMTALCRGKYVTDGQMLMASRIFETIGRTVIVDEKHMDAVTALSGSGPAYFFLMVEALVDAGVAAGLSRQVATELSAQTMAGSAAMLLEGMNQDRRPAEDEGLGMRADTTAAQLRAQSPHR